MARLPRLDALGFAQHVIQRGNNRNACFNTDQDFAVYVNWLYEYSIIHKVEVHAWVLMTNHVHLLMTPTITGGVSALMQAVGRRYVPYFNRKYSRSGTLWEGRFKSCLVQSERYLMECHRYIELNPVRAGMVETPEEYQWSSYRANALMIPSKLITPHQQYLALGKNSEQRSRCYRSLFNGQCQPELLEHIRNSTRRGLVFGNQQFACEIEALTGRRARPGCVGRPKKA